MDNVEQSKETVHSSCAIRLATSTFQTSTSVCFPSYFCRFDCKRAYVSNARALVSLGDRSRFRIFTFTPIVRRSVMASLLGAYQGCVRRVSTSRFYVIRHGSPT